MDIAIVLAGFFFLYIIVVLNIAVYKYGYEIFSDLDADAKLRKIDENPKKFKTSVVLVLTEHVSVVAIPIMLFIAFSSYNMILAVVWTICRTGEGVIQIYNKRSFWGLLGLARRYSVTSGAEKESVIDQGRSILETKNSVFKFAQILFSIGTLAYCILFVTYGVVPTIIGWFGLVTSVLYGLGNGVMMIRPGSKALWNVGGLLILIFELLLGVWLIISPFL